MALQTPHSLISDLWLKLSSLYGSAFTKPQGIDVDRNGVWTLTLSAMSEDDINYGFKKLVLSEKFETFPPNPKQFRALCLSRYGAQALPSVGEAFNEAKNYFNYGTRIMSHKAILFCALKVGETAFLEENEHVLYQRFKSLFQKVELAISQGLSLPTMPCTVQSKVRNKSLGRDSLNQIRKLLK